MTKRFSKTAKPRREPTLELVEWTAACQEYCDARLAGQLTEAHRAIARETWLAVKDRIHGAFGKGPLGDDPRQLQIS